MIVLRGWNLFFRGRALCPPVLFSGCDKIRREEVDMATAAKTDGGELSGLFEERGYVVLRGFLEPEVIRTVRAEMERLVDLCAERLVAEGRIRDPLKNEPFETRLARLYEGHMEDAPKSYRRELHLEGLFDLFFHPRLLDVVETFLGGEIRLYPNYTVRPKLPEHEATRVLWHQDGGYTERGGTGGPVETLRMVNVWTPLVPAREENGCMQFIPGTHRLGVVPHEGRQHYLEIAADHLAPRVGRAVSIPMDPGDVVLFHNLLFHQGLPNRSRTVRWSLDWRYQDATQPTMRRENGHLARSLKRPEGVVRNAKEWASLSFG
jgi:ectoine hydroxylase-related dioxygenase (phytanoyl-CoA dioxygenase family)